MASKPIFNRNESTCSICQDLNFLPGKRTSAPKAIRMSYFEVVESALIGCWFCSLICQGLKTLDARIKESSCIISVSAQLGKPFYISWDDELSQRRALELFTVSGKRPRVVRYAT
jgi:hypothetical protein